MARLTGLNHWMIQDDLLAREFDGILKLSPGYDPLRLSDIQADITFFAPLTGNVNSQVGRVNGDFTRNSEAIYRAALNGDLAIAGDHVSRHEYLTDGSTLGLLMEPATTNKCRNWNANPDAALENHTIIGPGIFSRVQDVQKLNDAGLQNVCTSGYVFKLDNSGGGTNATVYVAGTVANTNRHIASMYAYKDPASVGGGTFLQMEGTRSLEFTNTDHFRRIELIDDPAAASNRLGCIVQPGAIAYWVLNQLEESRAITSPIITLGGATSRALEQLFWSTTDINGDPVIAQPEGMAAVCQRFGLAGPDFPVQTNTVSILRAANPQTAILYYRKEVNGQESFRSRNDNNQDRLVVLAAPLQANQEYLLMLRWGGGNNQVGYKVDGVTRWSDSGSYTGYSGDSFQISNFLNSQPAVPQHSKNLYFWSVDKGTEWLEDFFAGVAN